MPQAIKPMPRAVKKVGAESGAFEARNRAQQVSAEKSSEGQKTTQAIEVQWLMRYD